MPIYLGTRTVRDMIPQPDAAIYVDDFESPAKLAEYINLLDHNDALYQRHLEWKTQPYAPEFDRRLRFLSSKDYRCRVCETIANYTSTWRS